MKPPPDTWEGDNATWTSLNKAQRMHIRKPGPEKPHKKISKKNTQIKVRSSKVTHAPTCFDGTLAEWNLLTSQQRYELKYTEYNRKKAADKKAKRESNWKKRGRALKVAPITYKGSVLEWTEMCPFRRRRIRLPDRSLENSRPYQKQYKKTYYKENKVDILAKGRARRCRQAADWFEKWGSKDAIFASRKALELEKNRGKPWASTYARDRAMEASFEAVDTV